MMIISSLAVSDICALRLTSRALHDKSTQQSFIELFKQKSFRLTPIHLQRFVNASGSGGLGCLLESCIITGLAVNSSSETTTPEVEPSTPERDTTTPERETTTPERKTAQDQVPGTSAYTEHLKSLLFKAFTNLQQHSPHRGITSICLQVVPGLEGPTGELEQPEDFDDWRSIWDTARNTFRITIHALNLSGLTLRGELDIFTSLNGCSLSCTDFLALPTIVSSKFLQAIKHLKVSVSGPHDDNDDYGVEKRYPRSYMHSANIFVLAMQMIKHTMPALESVTLHWYQLAYRWFHGHILPTTESEMPDLAFSRHTWPLLKACSLENVKVTERILLSFLAASNPQQLSMVYVSLMQGTWDSIFNLLVDGQSSVVSFHLDKIFSSQMPNTRDLVLFKEPGRTQTESFDREPLPCSLSGQNRKEKIRYCHPAQHPIDSPFRRTWTLNLQTLYGPLRRRYDFIKLNEWDYSALLKEMMPHYYARQRWIMEMANA